MEHGYICHAANSRTAIRDDKIFKRTHGIMVHDYEGTTARASSKCASFAYHRRRAGYALHPVDWRFVHISTTNHPMSINNK